MTLSGFIIFVLVIVIWFLLAVISTMGSFLSKSRVTVFDKIIMFPLRLIERVYRRRNK